MTREELRDYVDEQRTLDNIPYHVYSTLIDGIDTLEQEPCDTCGYEEGSIYCKEHCPHEAKIEQELKTDSWSIKDVVDTFKKHGLIREQEPCEDAISRQDVLDLAKKGVLISNGNYESVCKAINELPPVNPQPCEDAISRQNIIEHYKSCADMLSDEELEGANLVMEWIYKAPPVTPQPKNEDIAKAFQLGMTFGFAKKT